MKTTLNTLLGAGCLLALASCYSWQPPPQGQQQPRGNSLDTPPGGAPSRYWNGPTDTDPNGQPPNDPAAIAAPNPQQPGPGSAPTDPTQPAPNQGGTYVPPTPSTGGSNSTVGVPTQPTTPTPAPPPVVPDNKPSGPPYGIKVNGKPGFVYSPYDKTAGIVDVQGMAPGTKVKCPYTGKVFIVP